MGRNLDRGSFERRFETRHDNDNRRSSRMDEIKRNTRDNLYKNFNRHK